MIPDRWHMTCFSSSFLLFVLKIFLSFSVSFGIGATILICPEIQCLPYAWFFSPSVFLFFPHKCDFFPFSGTFFPSVWLFWIFFLQCDFFPNSAIVLIFFLRQCGFYFPIVGLFPHKWEFCSYSVTLFPSVWFFSSSFLQCDFFPISASFFSFTVTFFPYSLTFSPSVWLFNRPGVAGAVLQTP